jgi:hypothetical protein
MIQKGNNISASNIECLTVTPIGQDLMVEQPSILTPRPFVDFGIHIEILSSQVCHRGGVPSIIFLHSGIFTLRYGMSGCRSLASRVSQAECGVSAQRQAS